MMHIQWNHMIEEFASGLIVLFDQSYRDAKIMSIFKSGKGKPNDGLSR